MAGMVANPVMLHSACVADDINQPTYLQTRQGTSMQQGVGFVPMIYFISLSAKRIPFPEREFVR